MKLLVINTHQPVPYTGAFKKQGYVIEIADSLEQAVSRIEEYLYDVIIADVSRMCEGGYRFISRVKHATPRTGIIIVSNEGGTEEKIRALSEGADDYLFKPVNEAELLARTFTIIRRCTMGGFKEIECQGVRLEPSGRRVTCDGNEIKLTRKEYELLFFLVRNTERTISHEMIAEYLWGDFKGICADRFDFIYSHIKNLRKKLSDAGSRLVINTVYGVGYVVR